MWREDDLSFRNWFNGYLAGGSQNLKRRNVERPMFRNFKIANTKMTIDRLFDNFIIEFFFSFFINYLNNQHI